MQRLAAVALALLTCKAMQQLLVQHPSLILERGTNVAPPRDAAAFTACAPVQRARKFSAVFGTTSARSCEHDMCKLVVGVKNNAACKFSCMHANVAAKQITTAALTVISMRPRGAPSAVMSKKTTACTRRKVQDGCFRSQHALMV